MIHRHALHQRQYHIVVMLENADRPIHADDVFQYLQDGTARHLTDDKEDGDLGLLPQQGEQRQHIQGPFRQHAIILEESILETCMMGVEQHVKLWLRIRTHQSEYDHEQYHIWYHIDVDRSD